MNFDQESGIDEGSVEWVDSNVEYGICEGSLSWHVSTLMKDVLSDLFAQWTP